MVGKANPSPHVCPSTVSGVPGSYPISQCPMPTVNHSPGRQLSISGVRRPALVWPAGPSPRAALTPWQSGPDDYLTYAFRFPDAQNPLPGPPQTATRGRAPRGVVWQLALFATDVPPSVSPKALMTNVEAEGW